MTRVRSAAAVTVATLVAWALLGVPMAAAQTPATPATPLPASDVVVKQGIEYERAGGVTLTLDIYTSSRPVTGRPGLVLVHGGAWGTGRAEDVDSEGRLVAREGWVAFSLNYRLADQTTNPWPDELTDVQRGVRWVGAHAAAYGVDPTKLGILGLSAGGHLAILVGEIGTAVDGTGRTISDRDPPVVVRAVAAWSPPTHLTGLVTPQGGDTPPDCRGNNVCATFWRLPLVTTFLECHPERCPDRYAQASPTTRVTPSTVPVWWANAINEVTPLIQAEALDKALGAAQIDHQLEVVPGSGHADQYKGRVWNDMMPWLAAKLGAPTPPPVSFAGRNLLLSPVVVISVILGLALLVVLLALALRDGEGEI